MAGGSDRRGSGWAGRSALLILACAAVALPLVFLTLFFLWPTGQLIYLGISGGVGSLGRADSFGDSLVQTLSRPRTWQVLWWTVWMAAQGTFWCCVLGLPGAWVFYVLRWPGAWGRIQVLARGLISVPFVLPTVVVGVALQGLFAPGGAWGFLGWQGGQGAIVAGMVFFNYAVVVRIVGQAWVRLDPRPLAAARCLGAGPVRAFRTVLAPALAPALGAAAALVFLYCLSAYGLVRILGGISATTLEAEIYTETAQYLNLPGAAVLSILQLILVLAILAVSAWIRGRGNRLPGLVLSNQRPLRRSDLPALVFTGLTVAAGAWPIVSLVTSAFRRGGQWTGENFTGLLQAGASPALNGSSVGQAALVSLGTTWRATLVSLVVGLLVSIVVTRTCPGLSAPAQRRWQRGQEGYDALFMLPLGVSAVTVGFGFLITLQAPPLNLQGSVWLVALAQAVVAVPLVLRTITPTLRAIDPRQRQAAASLGAGPLRVFWTVEGPYLWRALLVSLGFAAAISLGEFGATSFLARPAQPTLPVAIFALIGRPGATEQGLAAAACVLLAALCAILVAGLEWVASWRPLRGGELGNRSGIGMKIRAREGQ